MSLSAEDVRKVARLSKLALTDDEVDAERERLAAVLEYMERLQALPLEGLEPMARVGELSNILREDAASGEPAATLPPTTIAALAPDSLTLEDPAGEADPTTFIKVPKVLGEGGGA